MLDEKTNTLVTYGHPEYDESADLMKTPMYVYKLRSKRFELVERYEVDEEVSAEISLAEKFFRDYLKSRSN